MRWVTSFWPLVAMVYYKALFPWCVIGSEDVGLFTHFVARVEIPGAICPSSKVTLSLPEELKNLRLPFGGLACQPSWCQFLIFVFTPSWSKACSTFPVTSILERVLLVLVICRSVCVHMGVAGDGRYTARCVRSAAAVVTVVVTHLTRNWTPVLLYTELSLQPMTNVIFFSTVFPGLILYSHTHT